jgi:hypothetical protein
MNDAEKTAQGHERVTVMLTPETAAGLARLRERKRRTKTELVNRAITVYEFIDGLAAGDSVVLVRAQDGTVQEVRFL